MHADVAVLSEFGCNSHIAAAIIGNQTIKHVVILIDIITHSN